MSAKEKFSKTLYKIEKLSSAEIQFNTEAIVNIYKYCWIATYPNEALEITTEDIESEFTDMESVISTWQKEKLAGDTIAVWVARSCDDNKIVGFCASRKGEIINELVYLYILPPHQGKFLGTQLMQKSLAWLGEAKPIELFGAAYNEQAIKFYEKFGFTLSDDSVPPKPLLSGKNIPSMRMIKYAN